MSFKPYTPIPFLFSGAAVSVVGTTAETTFISKTIKGGQMGPLDFMEVICKFSYTNVARNKTNRVKIGTSVYLARVETTTAGMIRRVYIQNRNSMASQVTFAVNQPSDQSTNAGAVATFTEDLSVDKTFAITGQPANAADTTTLESVYAVIWKYSLT